MLIAMFNRPFNTINPSRLCRSFNIVLRAALLLAVLVVPPTVAGQSSSPPSGSSPSASLRGWVRPSGSGLDLEVYFFDSVESADCPLRFAMRAGGTSDNNHEERANNGYPLQERIYSELDSTLPHMVIAEGLRGSGLQGRTPHFLIVRGHLFTIGPAFDSSVLVEIRLQRKPSPQHPEAGDTLLQLRKRELQPRPGQAYSRYRELAIPLPPWWADAAANAQGPDQAGITVKWGGGERIGIHSIGFRDSLGQVIRSHEEHWRTWRESLLGWIEERVAAEPNRRVGGVVDEILQTQGGQCQQRTTARWLLELMVKYIRQERGLPLDVEENRAEETTWPMLPKGKPKR